MRLVRSLLLATLAVGATVLISSDQVSHAIKPDKVTALEVYFEAPREAAILAAAKAEQ